MITLLRVSKVYYSHDPDLIAVIGPFNVSNMTNTYFSRKGYLLPDKQDDSFDLELGASASGVTGRKSSRNSSRQNSSRRYSGKKQKSAAITYYLIWVGFSFDFK